MSNKGEHIQQLIEACDALKQALKESNADVNTITVFMAKILNGDSDAWKVWNEFMPSKKVDDLKYNVFQVAEQVYKDVKKERTEQTRYYYLYLAAAVIWTCACLLFLREAAKDKDEEIARLRQEHVEDVKELMQQMEDPESAATQEKPELEKSRER